MAPALKPFQLLEINIISAQDLEPVSRKMRTYATAWVNPIRKLSTVVDSQGKNNPTWNDKFVFRVNEEFLRQDTSAVMIEIYAVHWFRHILVGTVRVLVGNLFPPPIRSNGPNAHSYSGMRFVALQVRRPSGRPQGILNIGVALLDSSMRSMPLYTQATSAVGYRDLMDDGPALELLQKNDNQRNDQLKPILRKSKSERSEFTAFESHIQALVAIPRKTDKGSSILSITDSMEAFNEKKRKGKGKGKGSSILSISESMEAFNGKKKKGKASSVISGAELIKKPKHKNKAKKGKPSSVLSDSVLSKQSSIFHKIVRKPDSKLNNEEKTSTVNEKLAKSDESRENKVVLEEKIVTKTNGAKKSGTPPTEKPLMLPSLPPTGKPVPKYHNYDYSVPKAEKYVVGAPLKGNSIWSDSEVGPSPSEVAAALMTVEKKYPISDNQSSVLDGWSVDESIEGLRSKLQRWRMELPPLYDHRGGYSTSSYRSSNQHGRRSRSADGGGLFSCFGNICGYECQCVCGKPPENKSRGTRFHSPARSYL